MPSDTLPTNNCIRLTTWDGYDLRITIGVASVDDESKPDQNWLCLDVDFNQPLWRHVGPAAIELNQLKALHRFIGRHIDKREQPTLPGLFAPEWEP